MAYRIISIENYPLSPQKYNLNHITYSEVCNVELSIKRKTDDLYL